MRLASRLSLFGFLLSFGLVFGMRPKIDCVSENLANLTCRWTSLDLDDASATFAAHVLVGRRRIRRFPCSSSSDSIPRCFLGKATKPAFTHFSLEKPIRVQLEIDKRVFNYSVSIPEVVRPNPPEEFAVASVEPRELRIRFSPPKRLLQFGLEAHVMFKSEFQGVGGFTMMTPVKTLNETVVTLPGLTPFTNYEIKIVLAATTSGKRSKAAVLWAKTAPDVPEEPPETRPHFFESIRNAAVVGKRRIVIHWKSIAPHLKNGPHFEYAVTNVTTRKAETEIFSGAIVTNRLWMRLEDADVDVEYAFELASRNAEGFSQSRSVLRVPKHEKDFCFDEDKIYDFAFGRRSSQSELVEFDGDDDDALVEIAVASNNSGLVWKKKSSVCGVKSAAVANISRNVFLIIVLLTFISRSI